MDKRVRVKSDIFSIISTVRLFNVIDMLTCGWRVQCLCFFVVEALFRMMM